MATADVSLTPAEVAALLSEGGWRPSAGLGSGRHWRRGREHLRALRDGSGRWHVDRFDPREAPACHARADVLPALAPFVIAGVLLGVIAGR